MKKLIFCFVALFLFCIEVRAEVVVVDSGITYRLDEENHTAAVVSPQKGDYEGDIIINSTVSYEGEEYRVDAIAYRAFVYYDYFGKSFGYDITSVKLPESLVSIGDEAFYKCTQLTELELPKSLEVVGKSAFANCTAIKDVRIADGDQDLKFGQDAFSGVDISSLYVGRPFVGNYISGPFSSSKSMEVSFSNKLQSIGECAFYNCKGLNKLDLPESLVTIGPAAFSGCSGLTSLKIPASVTQIENSAFGNCSNLSKLEMPNKNVKIKYSAFEGCEKLMGIGMKNSTQSTITLVLSNIGELDKDIELFPFESSTKNAEFTYYYYSPNHEYEFSYGLEIGESSCKIGSYKAKTKDIGKNFTMTSSSISYSIDYGDLENYKKNGIEMTKEFVVWLAGKKNNKYAGSIRGLDPNSTVRTSVYSYTVVNYDWSKQYVLPDFTSTTLPGQPMNTTTVLLCAELNIDPEETNVGFEWRRHDAPESMPSNKVYCAADDGKLMGALSGLNPEVYYDYRPFYTSDSDKTYYGKWMTFFTGDASVFFDPTVRTYSPDILNDYSAVLKGYALRGSEEIAEQGFELWKSWGTRADSHERFQVKGQRMQLQLDDLVPGQEYSYCTYVITSSGDTLGEVQSFTMPDTSDVCDILDEDSLSSDPVVIGYYNLQGVKSERPMTGFNIVVFSDGSSKKIYLN